MRKWTWWLGLIAGLAAALVVVSAIVQAVRQGSWGPIVSVGWIPAVSVAAWPAIYRRCLPRRRGAAG